MLTIDDGDGKVKPENGTGDASVRCVRSGFGVNVPSNDIDVIQFVLRCMR